MLRTAIFTLILLCPLTALAGPAPGPVDKKKARVLFSKAGRLFRQKSYSGALKHYQEASKLFPSYKIDLNIAVTLESMGRNTEAATAYHDFLARYKKSPHSARREAWLRLNGLKRWLARLRITCAVPGAQVTVDDKPVGLTPLPTSLYLQSGMHTIKVERERYHPISMPVRLRRGAFQKLTVQLMLIQKPKPAPAPLPAPALANDTTPLCPPIPEEEIIKARRHMTIGGSIALGAGLALVVGAAVLYGVGSTKGAGAHEQYMAANNPAEMAHHYADVEEARTMLIAGHGLAGAGVVALGLSLYQFLARPDIPMNCRVSMAPLPGGAAVNLGGRF